MREGPQLGANGRKAPQNARAFLAGPWMRIPIYAKEMRNRFQGMQGMHRMRIGPGRKRKGIGSR
jgi:hypothetical protein